jgi:protein TonB
MIPEKKEYGAIELKQVYVRNLWIAVGISVGVHLVLIGLYFFGINIGKSESADGVGSAGPVVMTNLPPPPPEDVAPPPPPPMIPPELSSASSGTGGVASIAGNPVPTPDMDLAPDAPEFASQAEISVATSEAGDGTGFGGLGDDEGLGNIDLGNQDVQITNDDREKVFEAWEFEEGQAPNVNYGQLQKNVVYPELAKRNNISGQVVLLVLVGKTGRAEEVKVQNSDNSLLDKAAVEAAKKTTFTPGIQNGTPVKAWLSIPVRFELD